MNSAWKTFLIDQGAEFDVNTLNSFGNPNRERRIPPQGHILCDLSHVGLIRVDGKDAESFLQNQLSNDLNEITETQTQISSYNTHKGRMIANLSVLKRGNTFYLKLCHDLVETLLKKLRMYVMMAKVTLEDASANLIHFGFAGPNAERLLADVIDTVPQKAHESVLYRSLSITRLSGELCRFEILGELNDAKQLWQNLEVQAAPVSSEAWRYLNIVAGMPMISTENSTAWVPQMLNFERIKGISFTKGCYPGQEIVARLNYLGQTKRRTYRLLANTDQLPIIGDKIIIEGKQGRAAEAGQVLNAVINPDGKIEMLAVLKSVALTQSLSLNSANIEILDLPYSLDD